MHFSNRPDHALITVYGDTLKRNIEKAVTLYQPDRDIRVLAPETPETLESAAKNSVLIFVGLRGMDDPAVALGRPLQSNQMIPGEIVAVYLGEGEKPRMEIMERGFDGCITLEDMKHPGFKKYLSYKIGKGVRRLDGLIQEEEYARLSDALSIAPVSMIIFDNDKKAVFVSDHYFRAYPRIAPRLIRGLRVYDAFEMMAKEEGLMHDDERYENIQRFWHNLDGGVEFTLDNGMSYRLKAIPLPNNRGTVVIGQNMTNFIGKGHVAD